MGTMVCRLRSAHAVLSPTGQEQNSIPQLYLGGTLSWETKTKYSDVKLAVFTQYLRKKKNLLGSIHVPTDTSDPDIKSNVQ